MVVAQPVLQVVGAAVAAQEGAVLDGALFAADPAPVLDAGRFQHGDDVERGRRPDDRTAARAYPGDADVYVAVGVLQRMYGPGAQVAAEQRTFDQPPELAEFFGLLEVLPPL